MPYDTTIKLTFDLEIEQDENSLKIWLDTVQPIDDMVKQGWLSSLLYDLVTTTVAVEICVNLFNGRVTFGDHDRGYVLNLGAPETVDFMQWKGRQPYTLTYKSGKPYMTERAKWEVVAVEQNSLERMMFAFTNGDKDDVFKLQMRLSQIFSTAKIILQPWDDIARMHYANGYETLLDVPEDERAESKEMLDGVIREWTANKPVWAR